MNDVSQNEPLLEYGTVSASSREAQSGWLIWLSLCLAPLFFAVTLSGEIDRRIGSLAFLLTVALFFYEQRRVRDISVWGSKLGVGCSGGILLAALVGFALDKTGVLEVWDQRDQMTLRGMLLVWSVFIVGMGLAARWTARKASSPRPESI